MPGLLKVDTTGDNDRTNSDRPLLDLSGLLSVKVRLPALLLLAPELTPLVV